MKWKKNNSFSLKMIRKNFAVLENMRTFASHLRNGPVAQLNRASDYGSEGYRFESCRDHKLGYQLLRWPNCLYKGF